TEVSLGINRIIIAANLAFIMILGYLDQILYIDREYYIECEICVTSITRTRISIFYFGLVNILIFRMPLLVCYLLFSLPQNKIMLNYNIYILQFSHAHMHEREDHITMLVLIAHTFLTKKAYSILLNLKIVFLYDILFGQIFI
ncbi:hypothetical protein ACJX0J_036676, partial [Zea mays]